MPESILTGSELLFQGAESRVYRGQYLGQPAIYKHRFQKKYRHPQLDADLTKQRIRCEVRNLNKCRSFGIDCPTVLCVRPADGVICMEEIAGETVAAFLKRRSLNRCASLEAAYTTLPERLGTLLAKFHDTVKQTHGDLTTSNLMMRASPADAEEFSLALLDFGLAGVGENVEDRAVDLYVLERAVQSNHAECAEDFNARMIKAYAAYSPKAMETVKRLDAVRQRGRKRVAFG